MTTNVTMKSLLEAGAHFGHQTHRWDPRMKPYIFGARNGVHIIDLQNTMRCLQKALQFAEQRAAQGGQFLFVGTKRQAQEVVKTEAERAQQPYVNTRWLGGTLTNFSTIKSRVDRMRQLEGLLEKPESLSQYTKKEQLELSREHDRLKETLWGIRDLRRVPDALFVVDPRKEKIAVAEATRLGIPVIGVTDTNCDPSHIDFVIPSNDDSLRAIALFTGAVADSVINGRSAFKDRPAASGSGEEGFMADKEAGEAEDGRKQRRRPSRPRGDRG